MSFRDSLATFQTKLEQIIREAEELPSDLLAQLLHRHAVKINVIAVTDSLSAVAKTTVEAVQASALKIDAAVAAFKVDVAEDATKTTAPAAPAPIQPAPFVAPTTSG